MFRLFYKYLILTKKATVRGIGTFYFERRPAKLDFANKVLHAPDLQIVFTPANANTDNGMIAFIALQQNVSEEKAAEYYNAFVEKLQENLDNHKSADFPQIGLLSQNDDGKLYFEATEAIKDYFPGVAAQRILREHAGHNSAAGDIRRTDAPAIKKSFEEVHDSAQSNDNWWIFAIALGIIGVATIVYYYTHNGNVH